MRVPTLVCAIAAVPLVVGSASIGGPAAAGHPGGGPTLPAAPVAFELVGRYATDLPGNSAEIATVLGSRLYVTNASDVSLDIVDVSDPAAPALERRVDLSGYGGEVTSVAGSGRLVAVAVKADPAQAPGRVVVLTAAGDLVGAVVVGAGPDSVVWTTDGRRIVVANEGEPSSYGQPDSVDPEGSVSVIRVVPAASIPAERRLLLEDAIDFRDFDAGRRRNRELPAGVRIFGPGARVSQDLEPEYVAIDAHDPDIAWVTLQENNALAKLQLVTRRVLSIQALGTKDHSRPGHGIDASDDDDAIRIQPWPVRGLYQPDNVASFSVGGLSYLLTANEGDARAYVGFDEEERAADVADLAVLPDAGDDAKLGRLNVTTAPPATPTGQTTLYAFGTRSFSIWSARTGALVSDSGDLLEQVTARVLPDRFNSNNDANNFDNRSDNKGPEPEAATVGKLAGRTLAFVGLERVGGVVVADVSDPRAPRFLQYLLTRDFTGDDVGPDSGPESITFVHEGPGGAPLLAVSHEVTGTVALFRAVEPDGPTTLSLLHNNDGESSLLPAARSGLLVGGVAAYRGVLDREIAAARAAGHSVANVYAGDAFLAGATIQCSLEDPEGRIFDAVAQRQMRYDVHVFGNHEFDYTPDFLERFVRAFERDGTPVEPFVSSNLDFTGEPSWADLLDADGLLVGQVTDGRVVARSAILVDPVTTARVGIVGATTPELATISSPRDVALLSGDVPSTAVLVQAEVDRLAALGVEKIVVASHLQNVANDRALVALLRGVDAAVAGGGDELLANPTDLLLPGDGGSSNPIRGAYPLLENDADGRPVPIVTTNGNYLYAGRLDLAFDAAGTAAVVSASSGPKRVVVDRAGVDDPADAVEPDAGLVASVDEPVTDCLAVLAATPVATTEVVFDRGRPGVRARQSNAGNLVADAWLFAYDAYAGLAGLQPRDATTIALQNGGGIRDQGGSNFLPSSNLPGPISRLDLINMLPFDNTIVVVSNVTAAELKSILERAAASLPGQGGQFLQIGALQVSYDPSRTANVTLADGTITVPGDRVRSVTLADGTPIVVDGEVVPGAPDVQVVTNNFTAGGGDNFPQLAGNPDKTVLRKESGQAVAYEEAAREYLQGNPEFPLVGSLRNVPATDARYAPYPTGAEVRISLP
jgi:2',3'-cyclic-nucleotide 2'-phosphodiesterase (5'-nucleotidase family)